MLNVIYLMSLSCPERVAGLQRWTCQACVTMVGQRGSGNTGPGRGLQDLELGWERTLDFSSAKERVFNNRNYVTLELAISGDGEVPNPEHIYIKP